MVKHFAYLGYWVYYVLDTVYVTDTHGTVLDQWEATDQDTQSFINSKLRINDLQDGLVLMHRNMMEQEHVTS